MIFSVKEKWGASKAENFSYFPSFYSTMQCSIGKVSIIIWWNKQFATFWRMSPPWFQGGGAQGPKAPPRYPPLVSKQLPKKTCHTDKYRWWSLYPQWIEAIQPWPGSNNSGNLCSIASPSHLTAFYMAQ